MDMMERMHRNAATVIYRSLGGKENMNKVWEIGLKTKSASDRIVMTKEMYDAIKKAHNLN